MRDEKLRQIDRIMNMLTEQNHDLRGKLISVQVGLQRKRGRHFQRRQRGSRPEGIAQPARSSFARG